MPTSRRRFAVTLVSLLLVVAAVPLAWQTVDAREQQATAVKAAAVADQQVTSRQAPADYDGDGIPDADDRCPTRPETDNGFQDDDGCPDVVTSTGAS